MEQETIDWNPFLHFWPIKMIFSLTFCAFSEPPVGAMPDTWPKYNSNIDLEKGTFKCFNGKQVIKIEQINDGFLDCSDGSDEPGTAANPNGTFYCHNNGYIPSVIPKWSVGDGLCDCCDGSDELFNKHAKCENTCQAAEKSRLHLFNKLHSAFAEGLKIKEKRTIEGKKKLSESRNKKSSIESRIKTLKEAKHRVEAAKVISTPTPTPTPEPTQAPTETPMSKEDIMKEMERIKIRIEDIAGQEMEGNSDENLKEEQKSLRAELESLKEKLDSLNEESKEEVVKEEEIKEEVKEEEAEEEANEEVKEEEEAKEEYEEEEVTASDHYEDDKIYAEEPEPESEPESEAEAEEEAEKTEEQQQEACEEGTVEPELPAWKRIVRAAWRITFRVPEVRSTLEESVREKTLEDLRRQIREAEDELRKVEDVADAGSDVDPAEVPILKQTFKNGNFEFEYPRKLKESYSNLGEFKKRDGDMMKFENGQYCWQTSTGKKTEMERVCWREEKLVSVVESSTCEYKAVFATPVACTKEKVDALEKMTYSELREVAKKVGLKE